MTDDVRKLLSAVRIFKSYGPKRVLDNICFDINVSDTIGIIGKNGVGKTTLLKILAGMAYSDKGDIYYKEKIGLSVTEKKRIGFYLGREYLPEDFTGRQYLSFLDHVYNDSDGKKSDFRIESIFRYFFDDLEFFDTRIRAYSLGMAQKIGICGAIVNDPELLILDEPFTGLDAHSCLMLINFLNQYKKNSTIIISSHDLNFIEQICNRILFIETGSVVFNGYLEEFTQNGKITLEKSFISASTSSSVIEKSINWIKL